MVTRTYLDKCNTIIEGSHNNLGFYPIGMLHCGNVISRFLLHFDLDKVKKLLSDGTYMSLDKMKHTLHLFNCASINDCSLNEIIYDGCEKKQRIGTCDIIAIKIPKEWDRGTGFSKENDVIIARNKNITNEGSNWFNSKSGIKWDSYKEVYTSIMKESTETSEENVFPDWNELVGVEKEYYDIVTKKVTLSNVGAHNPSDKYELNVSDGIYNIDTITQEYEKFINGEESDIIDSFHFEIGNENPILDVTNYVNTILENDSNNYGIMLCFAPHIESSDHDITQYIGFFTDKTNTFYQPYLETRYNDVINDDRGNFILGKENRLYLYSNIGGELTNLDNIPICFIDDVEYPVTQQGKGIYYATVKLNPSEYSKDMIITDNWSGVTYNGEVFDNIEMEFATLSSSEYFAIGNGKTENKNLSVLLNGIKHDEKLLQLGEKKVSLILRVPYTHHLTDLKEKAYYRIYVMDGKKEINVIDWDEIHRAYTENYFTIKTDELLPNEYRIDVKIGDGANTRIFKDELRFKIVDNFTKKFA